MCPKFPPHPFGIRWWTCKRCPGRRQTQPLLCSVPSATCAFTWTARRASGPQTLSASEGSCQQKGKSVSKQRLAHWIVEAIVLAYQARRLLCPLGVRAHSTKGVASSWALARGASIADICRAAGWATPNTFARFYNFHIEPVSSHVLGPDGQ